MRDIRLDGHDGKREHEAQERVRERLRAARDLQPRADTGADHELRTAVLRRMDRGVLEGIQKRYGKHIPPERLERARSSDTEFVSKARYERLLRTKYGLQESEASRVLGHFDPAENKTWVSDSRPLTLKRVAHERIHQLGHPKSEAELGRPLYEGLTQVLAVEAAGDPQLKGDPSVYPREVRVTHMLRALAGPDAAERAYFAGDTAALRTRIDRQLGTGSFLEVIRLSGQGRWEDVEQLIHQRNAHGRAPW